MARAQLIEMARHSIAHAQAGTIEQVPDVLRIPAENYTAPDRFEREVERIFKRVPLMLGLSSEIANPGDYKAITPAGVPILLARGRDGAVRAFLNVCRHRGAQILDEGVGRARRFVCPYHAWTYDDAGTLVGILSEDEFGEIDKACHSLVTLPVLERAGLVWAIANPASKLDIGAFLSGYDELLGSFGFESWTAVARREIAGPNWKIAYDGYLDLYHLPILHKDTFGPDFPNQALYYAWGPHQRVSAPSPQLISLLERPEDEWPTAALNGGVWTIFPHVSIASFDAGGGGILLSQLFPGASVGESITHQTYVVEQEPADDEGRKALDAQWELLGYVVEKEDYATGLKQQRALESGALDAVLFGRNEGGGQAFHGWVDRLLATEDADLPAVFSR